MNARAYWGEGKKPWGQLIAALANGDIPHRGKRDILDIRTILVRPCDVKPFVGMRFNASKFEFPFSSTFAKREVAEILTIDTPQLDASSAELGLDFEKRGRAKEIGREPYHRGRGGHNLKCRDRGTLGDRTKVRSS